MLGLQNYQKFLSMDGPENKEKVWRKCWKISLWILNNFTLDGINLVPSKFQWHYYRSLNRTMFKLILLKFHTHRMIFFNNYVAANVYIFLYCVFFSQTCNVIKILNLSLQIILFQGKSFLEHVLNIKQIVEYNNWFGPSVKVILVKIRN